MAGRIHVITLGGTIAMTGGASPAAPVVPQLGAEALVAAVRPFLPPELAPSCESMTNRPSANLSVADIARLALRVRDAAAERAAGVVVTQGTDTLEESAFLLSLFLGTPPVPVVVTGAMRPASAAGADGPANLVAAIRLAADEAARAHGVLVVMADRVFAAADVMKAHTHFVDGFAAHQGAAVAVVREGRARWLSSPPAPAAPAFDPARFAAATRLPHVPIVEALFESDPERALAVLSDADGAVLRAFGAGHVPESWVEPLAAFAAERPLVLASRVPFGPVLEASYGYPGSETDLIARRLIPARRLNAQKARLVLMLLLAEGCEPAALRRRFARIAA